MAEVLRMGPRKSSPYFKLPQGYRRRRRLHNHAMFSIRRKDNKWNSSGVGIIGKSTENARRIFAWCCGKYVLISFVCHSNYLINYLFTTITTVAQFSMVSKVSMEWVPGLKDVALEGAGDVDAGEEEEEVLV